MRQSFTEKLGLEASYDIAGMTEMYGPGTGLNCEVGEGIHYWADLFYIEIIDPHTLEPVPDGEVGEMVVTSLSKDCLLYTSSLEDAPWLLRRFPEVQRCTGPLEPHMLGCRLLVLDHAGTTLAQALAANIPLLLYWDPATASFTPEAEALPLSLIHISSSVCTDPKREGIRTPVKVPILPDLIWKSTSAPISMSDTPSP